MKETLNNLQENILASKHWIFDMDGTLTIGVHDFTMMRSELGLAPDEGILETVQAMPPEQAAPMWDKINAMEYHFASLAKPMPGAFELLEHLQEKGVNLGILTRNVMPVALQTLKTCNLDGFFTANNILDRASCEPKPHPAGIVLLLDQWRAKPSDSVMVGDYLFDLEAGKAANIATVHIDTSAQHPWPHMTDWGIKDLHQLIDN
ncbi:MAG: HAD superfamily hydrolase (TIGR01509 family) [Candidatus Paceibacteria bacterium]|jgi:HAD superfamily hydrolase (TIGR01509 family)|tara:strand:+ start:4874 stop:5488 length:615 start_codon:yes stop_codon:yes gene_type:complete